MSKFLKITRSYENGKQKSTIFKETNTFFKKIPILNNCCINPLTIDFIFQNDSQYTFLNENAFDLDITCYIDDKIEKNRKVGYGNVYKKTDYIAWAGDNKNGGKESIKIDVNKYIKNKLLNTTLNTMMKIVVNVCWHENSEVITSNIYAIISWNNLIEKYPINIYGSNLLSCNTRSFEIYIDMKTKEIFLLESKLYPIIKINYKEKLIGYDGEPDIKFGTINLIQNDENENENIEDDFKKLLKNGWIKSSDRIFYKKEKNSIFYLINDKNYLINRNNNRIRS